MDSMKVGLEGESFGGDECQHLVSNSEHLKNQRRERMGMGKRI